MTEPIKIEPAANLTERYRIRLEKEAHVFAAAHFITFAGNICEPLHGHNYGVAVEIEAPLDENQYVIDFIAVRDELTAITQTLDHRMLLPTSHPLIEVTADEREVTARFGDKRWVFPRTDCVLLPLTNTTSELLARYIGLALRERLAARLPAQVVGSITRFLVEVDENHGQRGIWSLAADAVH